MPTSFAASTTSVPAGTAILWPSIVTLTSGMRQRRPHVARMPQRVVLVLLTEVPEGRIDDPARRVAQAAEASAVLQTVGDPLEDPELDPRPFVSRDAVVRPARACRRRRRRCAGSTAQLPACHRC